MYSWCWSYVPVNDQNLVLSSQSIVYGQIVNSNGRKRSNSDPIGPWTNYEIAISEVLKAGSKLSQSYLKREDAQSGVAENIVISILGGYDEASNRTLYVPGAPEFSDGENVLLFVNHEEYSSYPINRVAHFALGAFVQMDVVSEQRSDHDASSSFAVRKFEMNLIDVSSDQPVYLRRMGDFMDYIRIASKYSLESPPPQEEGDLELHKRNIQYWSQASPQGIKDAWNFYLDHSQTSSPNSEKRFVISTSNGRYPRWPIFDSGNSVTFLTDPKGQPGFSDGGQAALIESAASWTNEAYTPVSYVVGGTTDAQTAFKTSDSINSILFDDPTNLISGSFSCTTGGTLAIGGWWVNGRTYTFRGQTFVTIVEGDIVTQDGISCWFTRTSNPQATYSNMMTHEMGHTLGLAHSCGDAGSGTCVAGSDQDKAIMRASAHNNGGSALGVDDINGLQFLYSSCYPSCGSVTPVTTKSITTKPVTTKSVTSSPLTSNSITTRAATTKAQTSRALTSSSITTRSATTRALTTGGGSTTASAVTTKSQSTTKSLTSGRLLTTAVKSITSGSLTTGSTPQQVTTKSLTTSTFSYPAARIYCMNHSDDFGSQGYFCRNDGLVYRCIRRSSFYPSYIGICTLGTSCKCEEGVDCSFGNTVSPCTPN